MSSEVQRLSQADLATLWAAARTMSTEALLALPAGLRKFLAGAVAQCALEGVQAVPCVNDRGELTLVLTKGAWTCETKAARWADALEQARAVGG